MLHLDALLLIYHLARVCRGSILEIGAFRGGSTIAAAWGMREATESKKLITIEPGGRLRKHRLATRNILRSLKRNLTRQGVAGGVSVIEGHSFEPQVIATVDRLLERAQVGLLILDADADCKRDIDRYGPKLMPGCWLVIDDYLRLSRQHQSVADENSGGPACRRGSAAPLGCFGLGTWVGQWISSGLFLPNNEVDHSIRRGNEKTIEILAQLFHLIAPWNPIDFQERRGGFGVVCFQLQPNVGLTQVWHQIDPKPVGPN